MDIKALPLAVIVATSSAAAQEISVTPTIPAEGQPVLDFRIENCTGEVGFGLMVYFSPHSQHLTDLCFVAESGTVAAGEISNNLTATIDGPNGRAFEDLTTGSDEGDRNSIFFYTDEYIAGCTDAPFEEFEYAVLNPPGYEAYADAGYILAHTMGYTITTTANTPPVSSAEVFFYIRDMLYTDIAEDAWEGGDLVALATFEGQSASLDVVEGGGANYGSADGTLTLLIDADGEVSATGSFSVQSARIAGQQPSDMSSLEAEFLHFRGHLLGDDGDFMRGYGIVSGTMTAVSGAQRPFRASITMLSCLADGNS